MCYKAQLFEGNWLGPVMMSFVAADSPCNTLFSSVCDLHIVYDVSFILAAVVSVQSFSIQFDNAPQSRHLDFI